MRGRLSVASALTEKAFADRRSPRLEALEALGNPCLARLEDARGERGRPSCRRLSQRLQRPRRSPGARYSVAARRYLRCLTASAHGLMTGPHAEGRRRPKKGSVPSRCSSRFRALRAEAKARDAPRDRAFLFVPFVLGAGLATPRSDVRVSRRNGGYAPAADRGLREGLQRRSRGRRRRDDGRLLVYNNVGIAPPLLRARIFAGLGFCVLPRPERLFIGAVLGYSRRKGPAGTSRSSSSATAPSSSARSSSPARGLSIGWSIVRRRSPTP